MKKIFLLGITVAIILWLPHFAAAKNSYLLVIDVSPWSADGILDYTFASAVEAHVKKLIEGSTDKVTITDWIEAGGEKPTSKYHDRIYRVARLWIFHGETVGKYNSMASVLELPRMMQEEMMTYHGLWSPTVNMVYMGDPSEIEKAADEIANRLLKNLVHIQKRWRRLLKARYGE
jgi:hypothetical protein